MNKIFAFLLYLMVVATGYANATESLPSNIACKGYTPTEATRVALKDLAKIFAKMPDATGYKFQLRVDKDIKDGSFGYTVNGKRVELYAGDEIGVTHALYTLLEDLGYTFDFTGVTAPVAPGTLSQLTTKRVTPRVRWRGIRQHVNFPMDISSYPIEEAKSYLEALLRMRFNKITFHSYPQQWYETEIDGKTAHAGHFFYGDTHYMFDNDMLKKSVPANDSIFCIPAAEPIFHDEAARSRFAVDWMQQLINYAADLGFYVQFSFEPRVVSVEQAIRTAEDICRTYPRINTLELITEETGGWGPHCTAEEVHRTLDSYFTKEIASDTAVCAPIRPEQSDLNALYTQIGIISQAIARMQERKDFGPQLKLGIYCAVEPYMHGAYRLARLALPETPVCIMPSHGSGSTATAFSQLVTSPDDMRNTELYSWIEFDGLMYLQQNSIAGNSRVMEHIDAILPGEQYSSLLYNHWRTAENRTSARYAMESTLSGRLSPDSFYTDYARRLSIQDSKLFGRVQTALQQANDNARNHLGNIGFCWVGAWRDGGSFAYMDTTRVRETRDLYMKAGEHLTQLISGMEKEAPAYDYLAFTGNRILCSVMYLDAFLEAAPIRTIKAGANGIIPDADKARAQEICDRALLHFEQYMDTHARMMPDRGCEGTLVSVWNAPIRGLKVYRSRMAGVPLETRPHTTTPVDAPPLPIFYGD